jgi:hypothetical protein
VLRGLHLNDENEHVDIDNKNELQFFCVFLLFVLDLFTSVLFIEHFMRKCITPILCRMCVRMLCD